MNVSCTNLRDACELAAHSERIGADAISAHTPLFYVPKDIGQLLHVPNASQYTWHRQFLHLPLASTHSIGFVI